MTDDRRVLAGPPKPRSSFSSPGWTPLLINGALLRHDAPFMFIGCSAVTELFGYTFTDRSEKSAASFCLRYARTTGPRPSLPLPQLVTRPTLRVRSCSLKGRFYRRGWKRERVRERRFRLLRCLELCARTEQVHWDLDSSDAQRGFHTAAAAHSLSMAPQHSAHGSCRAGRLCIKSDK